MKNMEIFINVLKSLIDEEDLNKISEEVESIKEGSYYKLGMTRDKLFEYMCNPPADINKETLIKLLSDLVNAKDEINKELDNLINDAKDCIAGIKTYDEMSKEELIAEINRLKDNH